ncbi:hypothetical protein [Rufibacter latericius]|uniref:Uncharacterized protein n=1 Tax=Rufibacter latericius TaxID=2487040 RepID=A0A3M9MEE4_9BACT|nr:hypothetical protein [Rufibacter latericius]RNI23555.1 hypothetical protein EFB08_18670 [Rufibacter latericius]
MEAKFIESSIPGWVFGTLVFTIGVLNLLLVHPVPGVAYFFLSCFYLPPANNLFQKWFAFSMPLAVKIVLGIIIILFTLGVSDLGDIIDKL